MCWDVNWTAACRYDAPVCNCGMLLLERSPAVNGQSCSFIVGTAVGAAVAENANTNIGFNCCNCLLPQPAAGRRGVNVAISFT